MKKIAKELLAIAGKLIADDEKEKLYGHLGDALINQAEFYGNPNQLANEISRGYDPKYAQAIKRTVKEWFKLDPQKRMEIGTSWVHTDAFLDKYLKDIN